MTVAAGSAVPVSVSEKKLSEPSRMTGTGSSSWWLSVGPKLSDNDILPCNPPPSTEGSLQAAREQVKP